ncbi:hypothetical protein G4B88_016117 [Cannabis sativa]|uniref:Fe2OG dioxygenase domain-containing protein n=1 Tax=Cannabis sativa TaxID=3483 RepID=A0A7J6FGX5_CANSA|nr:hypothetical protein G4B88_016117 [Cannabis sativa]
MEDPNLLASKYEFAVKPSDEEVVDLDNIEYSIPTIDFSLLTSDNLDQRSKILDDLRKACEDWGFFTLINHGISDSVMKKMMEVSESFFNMGEEEKKEFEGNGDILDPICYGTNINCNIGGKQVLFWRNFIRFIAHPQFESPYKPIGFRLQKSMGKEQEKCGVLMRGISETLGLEENCIEKATNLDMGLQYLLMNDYPSCPNPDQVIGLPPHTDPALMNILIQNDVGGLQILHNGKWVNWKAMPYSIIVDIDSNLLASKYAFVVKPSDEEVVDSHHSEYSIPTIDISLLTSDNLDQRSKILFDLRKACEDWGFFMLINHGISDDLMKKMMEGCDNFFNMVEEDKKEFEGSLDTYVLDPICYGTNFDKGDNQINQLHYWRNYIRFIVHPQFHSPHKPIGFRARASKNFYLPVDNICLPITKFGKVYYLGFSAQSELIMDKETSSLGVKQTPEIEKKFVHRVYDAIAPHFSSTRYAKWPKVAAFLSSLALDLLSWMLDVVMGNRGSEVLVADAVNLPYRTGFGDAAISIAVLHHLSTESRRKKAIEELVRVVKKGGLVLITVWAAEQEDRSLLAKWTPLNQNIPETEERNLGKVKDSKETTSRSEDDSVASDDASNINNQEYFIPWHLPYHRAEVGGASACAVENGFAKKDDKKGAVVYNRYYHVFSEGELERLVVGMENAVVVDSFNLNMDAISSITSKYEFAVKPNPDEEVVDSNDSEYSIPTIDISLLTSDNLDQRSKILYELHKAFNQPWYFGYCDEEMVEAIEKFFNMSEEEKKEFEGCKDVLEPISCGTNFNCNTMGKQFLLWRETIRLIVHPQFHSPYKPLGFRPSYWSPHHTDPTIMNFLTQNDVVGLQIFRQGKWIHFKAIPNTIIVSLGDQMQILTNELYKSVKHRAVVNNKSTRISIVSAYGPRLESKVVPIPELLEAKGQNSAYGHQFHTRITWHFYEAPMPPSNPLST